ncbi:MAG TPA: DUF2442 domain-containing protein [Thermoanaerobaculia bacterium]|nr:DUF2442 domain-containing protein [Thermoanaerobaculia bacterium]
MSELRIRTISFSDENMIIHFSDGREIVVPVSYFSRLKAASGADRNQWALIGRGLGVHWESLDEDLSVENILTAYSKHQREAYVRKIAS